MSIDGLWSVSFGVPTNKAYGAGVLVFSLGHLYGGDASYYYIGEYSIDGTQITAKLKVKHHQGEKNNVLGHGINEASLTLTGPINSESITVTNGQFMAVLKKLEDL